jgi:hypothetical protein
VSLIGSLEQFDLENVLRRIEVFAKTGVIVVKQGEMWVEFYFRQGQLICIGPMRTNVTLIDRLLQAQLISSQVLPQILSALVASESNETRIAATLIQKGYLNHDMLRTWTAQEASQVLQAVSVWSTGEIYFEEDRPAPANRLLVALSVSTLLDARTATASATPPSGPRSAAVSAPSTNEPPAPAPRQPFVQPVQTPPASISALEANEEMRVTPLPEKVSAPVAHAAPVTGLLSASQLIDEDLSFNLTRSGEPAKPGSRNTVQLIDETPALVAMAPAAMLASVIVPDREAPGPWQGSLTPPQPITNPLPPTRIDTSFMTPELVLAPIDLSSLRERNPLVQLTPDQWRLFALIDGQITLHELCQVLVMPREQVCIVAGELIALGLVMPFTQMTGGYSGLPAAAHNSTPNLNNRAVQSGPSPVAAYRVPQPQPVATSVPFMAPVASQRQWGNSNANATFTMSGDWSLSSQQPASSRSQPGLVSVPVGGYR